MNEYELIEKIRPFRNIIVYGAKQRGRIVAERLGYYFAKSAVSVAVSDTKGESVYCSDYLVKNIKDFADTPSCAVLVAAQEIYHGEMEDYAKKIGFSNIIRISDGIFNEMKFRHKDGMKINELIRIEKHSQFLQHHTLNQIRLNRLRDNVRRGKRIKIIFLLSSVAKFNHGSVYRALEERSELFDCAIFCIEELCTEEFINLGVSRLDELRRYYERLKTEKFNVIWGYDDANNPISLDTCDPDIVIYSGAYLALGKYDANHSIDRIVSNYLSCCIPYGMFVANNPEYHFNVRNVVCSWLYFIDTRQAFNLCANYSVTKGINAVLSGWPGLDEYTKTIRSYPNIYRGKRLVIYAPHYTLINRKQKATFHIHYNIFLEMLEKYPDIHFIFKPHPMLGPDIIRREKNGNSVMRYKEYETFCDAWEKSSNGSIVTDDSFIDLFKKADCLITDSYSFLTIWLPTGKPCIALTRPEIEDPYMYYYDFIRPVVDSYYVCKTVEDIEKTFEDVVINGSDPKAEERKKQCNKLIYNLGNAGESIADYIERQLKN